MNSLIVLQTSQGLASWVISQTNAVTPSIVVGYDGRHSSRSFAELAASAFLHKGIEVIWFDSEVHTPLVPFTVKNLKAAAGVMITASHNPKDDNGYKVYASNGCQINTPADEMIQAFIMQNLEVDEDAWDVRRVKGLRDRSGELTSLYVDSVVQEIKLQAPSPRFVYTPLHGVGLSVMARVVHRLIHPDVPIPPSTTLTQLLQSVSPALLPVPEQAEPDGSFPTVPFPNPEEAGALALAQSFAETHNITLVIANDPDADRLALAEKLPTGTWYQFTGDELGALLAWHVYNKHAHSPRFQHGRQMHMFTTAVSSGLLSHMGRTLGFTVSETLTGFKWLGNAALAAGDDAVFAYEEALGYMLPTLVRDKDGVSGTALLLEALGSTFGAARSPHAELQRLYGHFGFWETANTYFRTPGPDATGTVFAAVRAAPLTLLGHLPAGTKARVRDAGSGTDSGAADGRSQLPVVRGNLMVTLWLSAGAEGQAVLQDGVRCTVRASGTEPKVKVYVECRSAIGRAEARYGAVAVMRAVLQTWFSGEGMLIEERWAEEVSA